MSTQRLPQLSRSTRALLLIALAGLALAACGGGGSAANASAGLSTSTAAALPVAETSAAAARVGSDAMPAAEPVADILSAGTTTAAADTGAALAVKEAPTAAILPAEASPAVTTLDIPATAAPTPAAPPVARAEVPAAAVSALQPPTLPRTGLAAGDLAVLYADGDATSEAIARAYQRARGIPEANLLRVVIPGGADAISDSAFAGIKADLDARLPAHIQATLVTWTQPSRVAGVTCAMGITSALAFGYNAALCGGCSRTQASAYYDTDTTRPYTDLRIRPSMMLGAATLEAAQALIARGVAADGAAPTGTGWLLRTADAARSVRYTDYPALPAAWATDPGPALRYLDASPAGWAQELVGYNDVMFYFTGLVRVPQAASNRFLPGAVADTLTSFGGFLPGAKGQMPVTDWLAAGATASYGTVEEPCNFAEKFSRASVLVAHYARGATLIEAYWKSVAWPGQGLFVGEPLARPWAGVPSATVEGNELVIRSRGLRRNGAYRVEWLDAGGSAWRTLASATAGQPRPTAWRVPLPVVTTGGKLRWVGPCPLQPAQSCVLG